MKNLLSNKTLQATYGGDVMSGSVGPGMLGAFLLLRRKAKGRYQTMLKTASNARLQAFWGPQSND